MGGGSLSFIRAVSACRALAVAGAMAFGALPSHALLIGSASGVVGSTVAISVTDSQVEFAGGSFDLSYNWQVLRFAGIGAVADYDTVAVIPEEALLPGFAGPMPVAVAFSPNSGTLSSGGFLFSLLFEILTNNNVGFAVVGYNGTLTFDNGSSDPDPFIGSATIGILSNRVPAPATLALALTALALLAARRRAVRQS